MDEILTSHKLLGHQQLQAEYISNLVSSIVVGGIGAVLVLVFLFALCTCKDSSKEQTKKTDQPVDIEEEEVVRVSTSCDHMTLNVDTAVPEQNGMVLNDVVIKSRPTSMDGIPNGRQLPSPPTNPAGGTSSAAAASDRPLSTRVQENAPASTEEDPYDHLGQTIQPVSKDDGYDHFGNTSATSSKGSKKKSGRTSYLEDEQLYACVDDDDDTQEDDPYARMRSSSNSQRIKAASAVIPFSDTTYAYVPEDDFDDPYSKINGEEASYPQNSTKDPYLRAELHHAAVIAMESSSLEQPQTDDVPRIVEADYAIVNKPRNSAGAANNTTQPESLDHLMAPPAPPRAYEEDDFRASIETNPLEDAVAAASGPLAHINTSGKVEPPYTKVTARESLASINARQQLLNMYETVAETENMYATVDGGSGDGVIVKRAARRETSKRSSQASETYAEIGATGGHPEFAPAPPSLDSLRTVTKQNHGDFRKSGGDFIQSSSEMHSEYSIANKRRTFPNDFSQAHYDVPSAKQLPAFAMSVHGGLTSAASYTKSHDVKTDPNYQTVQDCMGENDSEYDPNYETVEDAKRKAAALRQNKSRAQRHDYEEVSPSQISQNSAEVVRERVLRQHMYEDIREVKQHQKLWRKSQE